MLASPPLQAIAQEPKAGDTSSEPPFPALADVLAANNLKSTGKPPFHLKLDFQVFGLSGKAEERGTLDAWWAGPKGSYVEFNTPSLGTLHGLRSIGLPNDQARRSLYLLRLLTDALWTPYGTVPTKGKLITQKKTENSITMNCMHVEPDPLPAGSAIYRTACADDTNETIRIVTAQDEVEIRNRVGKFGPTRVALDVQVLLLGRPAITGHVEKLEGFDPEHSAVVLTKPISPSGSESARGTEPTPSRGSVRAGKLIHKTDPTYPIIARERRVSGSVILSATVTKAGTVGDLFQSQVPIRF